MRLAADDTQDLDETRLRALLDLAGPEVALELADRLMADLGGVDAALCALVGSVDRAAIRAQTHILTAISGTIGASSLHLSAKRLNDLAHAGDAPSIAAALGETLGLLRRLLARLKACLSGMLPAT